jgi:hypothetical protein
MILRNTAQREAQQKPTPIVAVRKSHLRSFDDLLKSPYWEIFMTVVTMCDAASLAIYGAADPEIVDQMQEILSLLTFIVYATDMIFKMAYGLSPQTGFERPRGLPEAVPTEDQISTL